MNKDTQEKINQLQLIEQNMQNFLMQKQQFQTQMIEIESALKELEKTDNAYKIIGNIMVNTNKDDLMKDLKEKKETISLRIKTLEKQENDIKEKAGSIQKEVMEELKEK